MNFQERRKINNCKNSVSISTPNMVQGGPKCKSGTQFAKSYKVRAHPTAYRPVWETSIFHTNGCWSNRKSRLITLFWREQMLKDFSTNQNKLFNCRFWNNFNSVLVIHIYLKPSRNKKGLTFTGMLVFWILFLQQAAD